MDFDSPRERLVAAFMAKDWDAYAIAAAELRALLRFYGKESQSASTRNPHEQKARDPIAAIDPACGEEGVASISLVQGVGRTIPRGRHLRLVRMRRRTIRSSRGQVTGEGL